RKQRARRFTPPTTPQCCVFTLSMLRFGRVRQGPIRHALRRSSRHARALTPPRASVPDSLGHPPHLAGMSYLLPRGTLSARGRREPTLAPSARAPGNRVAYDWRSWRPALARGSGGGSGTLPALPSHPAASVATSRHLYPRA